MKMYDLAEAILTALTHQSFMTIGELKQVIKIPCYDGEVQEVVWRLTAAQKLIVTAEGKICRKT
jgi:hypothetical protein